MPSLGSSPISSSEDEFKEEMTGSLGMDGEIITVGGEWDFSATWSYPSYDVLDNVDFNAGFIILEAPQGYTQRLEVHVNVKLMKGTTLVLDRWGENNCYKKLLVPNMGERECYVNLGRLGVGVEDSGTYSVSCNVEYVDGSGRRRASTVRTKDFTIE
jgi:hypothetical protein